MKPTISTADYTVLIVSYGTMSRVCRTAIDNLQEEGIDVGMIRPQTLFPFPEQPVDDAAGNKAACRVVRQRRDEHGADGGGRANARSGAIGRSVVRKCGGECPRRRKSWTFVRIGSA